MKTLTILLIIAGVIAIGSIVLYVIHMGRTEDAENEIYLNRWRETVKLKDKVKHNGIVYHVIDIVGRKYVVSNYNDVIILNYEQLYPID